jgi:hypothetical protein
MTATAVATTTRAPEARPRDDLRGRLAEFMVVGGFTFVLLPLAWLLRAAVGFDASELAVGFTMFHLAYVLNDPHFTVTYFLFYKDMRRRTFDASYSRAQRARYIVSGFVVPALLVVWAAIAIALRSAQALGWMLQLMFLLVGWHYAKQGFGVLTVLSARRGVSLDVRERTVILAHCFAAWAYAWANPSVPAGDYEEKGVVYRALAHPQWLEVASGIALAASTVALAWVLVRRWRRERRLLPLAPLACFLVTIWWWTIYSSADPFVRYMIPALHSLQYFYFVWLMRRNEAREAEGPPSFGRPVAVRVGQLALSALALGWLLFRGVPTFLDDAIAVRFRRAPGADALGPTPFFAAFFVVVNLHHYFMDHVIWRRENPDTRYLRG